MHVHAAPTGNRLKLAAGATGLFVVAEAAIGWWAHSLALISDAGHNLTDMAALLLSAWAFAIAAKPADPDRSFGYHRVAVLAALANALTLMLLAGYIFVEAERRLVHPASVASWPMIVVAILAFLLNGAIVLGLHGASHGDVNIRSAVVHMAGDALSSVGVLLAGIAVLLTGASRWDPAVSILIGAFILWSSWGIIRETVDILLEGTPRGLRLAEVADAIARVPGVGNVHDLHTWTLGPSVRALSAHVVLSNPALTTHGEVAAIVRRVKGLLADRYAIVHATIETHCSDDPDTPPLACDIHRASDAHNREHAPA